MYLHFIINIIIYNFSDSLLNGKNESDSDSDDDEDISESEGKILFCCNIFVYTYI